MDLYAQSRSDLASSVGAQISAGDAAWIAANYGAAVVAYKAAGAAGAQTVGPEIDAAGYPSATQKFTQQAWQLNANLGAIDPATAGEAQALTAQTIAYKMQQLYQQAISAGALAQNPTSSSSGGMLTLGLTLLAVAVAGGAVFGLHSMARGRRPSRAPTRRASVSSSSARTRRMSTASTRRA